MNWTPLFSEITDSSIWELPLHVRIAWVSILAKKDFKSQTIRTNHYRLAKIANITEEQAKEALNVLCSPDPRTLSQADEGRRLMKIDEETYLVLNGKRYSDIIRSMERRQYLTMKQQEHRAKKAAQNNPASGSPSVVSPTKPFTPPTMEEVKLQAAKIGLSEVEAEKFWSYYASNGWRVGRNPMKAWHVSLSGWKLRATEMNHGNTTRSQPQQGINRNVGNANEGNEHRYAGIGRPDGELKQY